MRMNKYYLELPIVNNFRKQVDAALTSITASSVLGTLKNLRILIFWGIRMPGQTVLLKY